MRESGSADPGEINVTAEFRVMGNEYSPPILVRIASVRN
jgi:hypothetical protein